MFVWDLTWHLSPGKLIQLLKTSIHLTEIHIHTNMRGIFVKYSNAIIGTLDTTACFSGSISATTEEIWLNRQGFRSL